MGIPGASCCCLDGSVGARGSPIALQGSPAPCRAPCCWAGRPKPPVTPTPRPRLHSRCLMELQITVFVIGLATPTADNALLLLPAASGPSVPGHHPTTRGYCRPNPGSVAGRLLLPTGGDCAWVTLVLGPWGACGDPVQAEVPLLPGGARGSSSPSPTSSLSWKGLPVPLCYPQAAKIAELVINSDLRYPGGNISLCGSSWRYLGSN